MFKALPYLSDDALGETSSSYIVVNAVNFTDHKYKNLTINLLPLNSVQFRDWNNCFQNNF